MVLRIKPRQGRERGEGIASLPSFLERREQEDRTFDPASLRNKEIVMIEDLLETTDTATKDKPKPVKDKKDKKDKDKDPDPGCCTPPDNDPGPIGG